MLAKSPAIIIDLPEQCRSGWVSTPTLDIRVLGTIREPFTALQAECQADRNTAVADHEIRIGQRTT